MLKHLFVVLEVMPAHLRESHREAGNAGTYPHNGARRFLATRSEAACAAHYDNEWSRVIRPADAEDMDRFERLPEEI